MLRGYFQNPIFSGNPYYFPLIPYHPCRTHGSLSSTMSVYFITHLYFFYWNNTSISINSSTGNSSQSYFIKYDFVYCEEACPTSTLTPSRLERSIRRNGERCNLPCHNVLNNLIYDRRTMGICAYLADSE